MSEGTIGALRGDAAPARTRTGAVRLDTIDLLRGLAIALMVLDHVRDYVHFEAFLFNPADLARTTPLLFATRWITHLCAPTFVFLSGVSVFLQRANGRNPATLATFLLTRGAWLVLLELTIVSFGFNMGPPLLFVQVIWAIGVGMILMAALVWLRPVFELALGVAIVAGHQLLAGIDAAQVGSWAALWRVAMEPGLVGFMRGFVVYPAIPWFGVMCLGYGLGFVFLQAPPQRQRSLLALSLGAIALFGLLRALNGYGDPAAWASRQSATGTVMSFMNVSKYPPSLMFVLVTLGVSRLLSLPLERLGGLPRRALLAFGRTPLFTYILHIYAVHLSALALGMSSGLPARSYFDFLGIPRGTPAPDSRCPGSM